MMQNTGIRAEIPGNYVCTECGEKIRLNQGDTIPLCPHCGNGTYQNELDLEEPLK